MSVAIVYTRASIAVDAPLVTVEVHLSPGLAGLSIVGLPETAVKESKDRVRSALLNAGFEFPARRIIINLAPADLPKEGARFDLPIAIGILAASEQLPKVSLHEYEFLGELALSGDLRGLRGALPAALAAQLAGRGLIVPKQNESEVALLQDENMYAASHLLQVCGFLNKNQQLDVCRLSECAAEEALEADLADVKGQVQAKRALEIAAAGQHSLLFFGPPGTGKTMLASRLTSILPPLEHQAALQIAALASISRKGFDSKNWQKRPFRAPHHTSSSAALVGGGRPPRPGEISLAHHGVLFLDELPEFQRQVLECLREPLESGSITVSRAAFQAAFPADFQLIAAMNPCPCGYAGSKLHDCRCSAEQVLRYLNKLSGPLLDRIDMQLELAPILPETLQAMRHADSETSEQVLQRVLQARQIQLMRQSTVNANLTAAGLEQHAVLQPEAEAFLARAMRQLRLSARVYHRILRVALTIADLEGCSNIEQAHVAEALNYRRLDRLKGSL